MTCSCVGYRACDWSYIAASPYGLSIVNQPADAGPMQGTTMPSNANIRSAITAEPPSLTRREEQVLYWCSCGKTSWEISRILDCQESTVNFHVGNVLRKLTVHTRVEAVLKALRHGLLPASSEVS